MNSFTKLILVFAFLLPVKLVFTQAPVISGFSPVTAMVGNAVTINGNNFDPIASGNAVFFGTVRAVVTSATPTQLIVTVPAGAASQPLHVTVNQLTAFSSKSFVVAFPGGPDMTSASFFATGVDASTGNSPYRMAIADLDADGKPELVATNNSSSSIASSSISVFKNNSTSGNISLVKTDFPSGPLPYGICISDLNGDTKPDIVVTNYGVATVSVLINTTVGSTISFAPIVTYATGNLPTSVAANDIDGDGRPDIVTANSTSHTISVLRNTSAGTLSFASKVDFATANGPATIVLSDVNEDGKPDVAVACQSANSIDVFRNTSNPGSISFAAKIGFATASGPRAIVSTDLDGDGKNDLVTANYSSGSISMLRNTTAGGAVSFASKIDSTAGGTTAQTENLTTGDFNGDGKPDLVVVNRSSNTLILYRAVGASGTIALSPRLSFSVNSAPYAAIINDLDLDGKADISVLRNFVGRISVYRSAPPPKITAVTPLKAAAGSSVTFRGYNFSADPSANVVYFGAAKAVVTASSDTSLTVTVPNGATHATPTVRVNAMVAYAPLHFSLVFPGNATLSDAYAIRKEIPTANIPADVVLADLNDDGKNDIITGNPAGTVNIRVLPNSSTPGNISFNIPGITVGTVIGPDLVATGDFDGDDKVDIVVGSYDYNSVKIIRNNGNFSFTAPSNSYSGSNAIVGVYVHDVNGDGKPDIISGGSYSFTILQNTSTVGNISFDTREFSLLESNNTYGIGDMDQDGKVDIVAGRSFYRNTSTNGIISFETPVLFMTGEMPASLAIGDLNNDHKPDIAAVYSNAKKLVTFDNTSTPGTISFVRQAAEYTTGPGPKKIFISDLNGDGRSDVGVACISYDAVCVFANNTTGTSITFIDKVDYGTPDSPGSLFAGDLDGDGKVEVIASNRGSSSVSVFRYAPYQPLPDVPTIVSFSPLKAPVGSIVTIHGTNFSTLNSNNVVRFGPVKAEVITASSTSLTVKVPGGAAHDAISVTNAIGYTAYSGYPFHTTFYGGGAFRQGSFSSYSTFATGALPYSSIAADLDNDGKSDIVSVNRDANSISVLRNTTVGKAISFATKTDYSTGGVQPQWAASGDLDGDGLTDIVVTNYGNSSISIFRNTSAASTISFAPAIIISTMIASQQSYPENITIRDIDGDGKPDIIIVQRSAGTSTFFRNTSTGSTLSFAPMVNINMSSGSGAARLATGDFDGNGKIDLMTSEPLSNITNTSIPGAIAFTGYITYNQTTGAGYGIASLDVNSDGKTDILHLDKYNSPVAFMAYRNNSYFGTQLFAYEGEYGSINGGLHTHAGISDMNGDGRPDVVLAYGNGVQGASIFRNRTGITGIDTFSFAAHITYPYTSSNSIAVADLDNDGKAEIIITNGLQNTLSIARNLVGEPIRICQGNNTTFPSGLDGSSFQWQVSIDSVNFANISDNINYSGTNTATLQLSGMSTSFHNYQFRCVSNTATSEIFQLRFGNTWTGAVNNQWENPGNWSCGSVPDGYSDVTVNDGAIIVINSNVAVASLTVNSGSVITVNPGFILTLSGN